MEGDPLWLNLPALWLHRALVGFGGVVRGLKFKGMYVCVCVYIYIHRIQDIGVIQVQGTGYRGLGLRGFRV